MDPKSAIQFVSQIISAIESVGNCLGEAAESGIVSWRRMRTKTPNDCYLRVYDLDYAHNASQRLVEKLNNRTTLKCNLESLPEQETMFRVYLVEESSMDNSTLLEHSKSRGFLTDTEKSNGAERSFEALASQWKKSNAMEYQSIMYSYDPVERPRNRTYDRVTEGLDLLPSLIRLCMSVQIGDITGTKDKSISIIPSPD
jgi:hypothetical protein